MLFEESKIAGTFQIHPELKTNDDGLANTWLSRCRKVYRSTEGTVVKQEIKRASAFSTNRIAIALPCSTLGNAPGWTSTSSPMNPRCAHPMPISMGRAAIWRQRFLALSGTADPGKGTNGGKDRITYSPKNWGIFDQQDTIPLECTYYDVPVGDPGLLQELLHPCKSRSTVGSGCAEKVAGSLAILCKTLRL